METTEPFSNLEYLTRKPSWSGVVYTCRLKPTVAQGFTKEHNNFFFLFFFLGVILGEYSPDITRKMKKTL